MAFADLTFIEIGMKCSNQVCSAILAKICIGNIDISNHLIFTILDQFFEKLYYNKADEYVSLLFNIMSIDDAKFEERVRSLLLAPRGIATMIQYFKAMRHQQFHSQPSTEYRKYVDCGKRLYGQLPQLAQWVDIYCEQDELLKLFRREVNPLGRVVPSKEIVENIKRLQVRVSGATGQAACCNGVYKYHNKKYESTSFRRDVHENGMRKKYMIYRARMNAKSPRKYAWFISEVALNQEHCSKDDDDYFMAYSSYEEGYAYTDDVIPPSTNWENVSQAPDPALIEVTCFLPPESLEAEEFLEELS